MSNTKIKIGRRPCRPCKPCRDKKKSTPLLPRTTCWPHCRFTDLLDSEAKCCVSFTSSAYGCWLLNNLAVRGEKLRLPPLLFWAPVASSINCGTFGELCCTCAKSSKEDVEWLGVMDCKRVLGCFCCCCCWWYSSPSDSCCFCCCTCSKKPSVASKPQLLNNSFNVSYSWANNARGGETSGDVYSADNLVEGVCGVEDMEGATTVDADEPGNDAPFAVAKRRLSCTGRLPPLNLLSPLYVLSCCACGCACGCGCRGVTSIDLSNDSVLSSCTGEDLPRIALIES